MLNQFRDLSISMVTCLWVALVITSDNDIGRHWCLGNGCLCYTLVQTRVEVISVINEQTIQPARRPLHKERKFYTTQYSNCKNMCTTSIIIYYYLTTISTALANTPLKNLMLFWGGLMVYQLPIKSTLHMVCLAMNYYYHKKKKNIFISFFSKIFLHSCSFKVKGKSRRLSDY